MAPLDYSTYFVTIASVGATLFGLIFIVISIAPQSITAAEAPLERQVKATAAYTALLNPLIIALFALIPGEQIGIYVAALGGFGLINTCMMALTLLRESGRQVSRLRHSLFILAGFVLYSYEMYFAVLMLRSPSNPSPFIGLANILIILYIYGVFRAWDLVGIRQFHLRNWLFSSGGKKDTSDPPAGN